MLIILAKRDVHTLNNSNNNSKKRKQGPEPSESGFRVNITCRAYYVHFLASIESTSDNFVWEKGTPQALVGEKGRTVNGEGSSVKCQNISKALSTSASIRPYLTNVVSSNIASLQSASYRAINPELGSEKTEPNRSYESVRAIATIFPKTTA